MKLYYILFDLMMAILFFLIGIYFYKSNGKAANFLTGNGVNLRMIRLASFSVTDLTTRFLLISEKKRI